MTSTLEKLRRNNHTCGARRVFLDSPSDDVSACESVRSIFLGGCVCRCVVVVVSSVFSLVRFQTTQINILHKYYIYICKRQQPDDDQTRCCCQERA